MTSKPKSFFKIASEIHRHVSYRYKLAMILTGSKARLEPPAPDTIMPGKHLLAGSEKEILRLALGWQCWPGFRHETV